MKINCGDNIRKYREFNKLTQRELAQKINVSHATIHSWESNRTEPKMGAIEKLCAVLGCSKADLIGLDNGYTTLDQKGLIKEKILDLQNSILSIPIDVDKMKAAMKREQYAIDELAAISGVPLPRIEALIFTPNNLVSWNELKKLHLRLGDIVDFEANERDFVKNQQNAISEIIKEMPGAFGLDKEELPLIEAYREADSLTQNMVKKLLGLPISDD